jgi:hypothetical protein
MPTESLERLVQRRKRLRLKIERLARGNEERRTETAEQRRRLHQELQDVIRQIREIDPNAA